MLKYPRAILLDWHGTLVDTMEAMYHALNDTLARLSELGLRDRLMASVDSRTQDDAKLVEYVREHACLHPKIPAERKVSRTDILEVLFGPDEEAKKIAHGEFCRRYANHSGKVKPFEEGICEVLQALRRMQIRLAVQTNRSRQFLQSELQCVDETRWAELFDAIVCGDDTESRKPSRQPIYLTLEKLGIEPGPECWFVGDSTTDTVAAKRAGITSIFFNGAGWDGAWIEKIFPDTDDYPHRPDVVVANFGELLELVRGLQTANEQPAQGPAATRILSASNFAQFMVDRTVTAHLVPPRVVLFDWHATLVDTLDAMYQSVDDVLPRMEALGLQHRLVDPSESKTLEDARLVEHVRDYRRLHPKVKAARKISRTDIFEVLFGDDDNAKRIAHAAFNVCYRNHYGQVYPFEPGVRAMLETLRRRGLQVGVLTNRDREFLEHEIAVIEGSGWSHLFDTMVCGDDTRERKPAPDPILKALDNLGVTAGPDTWYVGDSTTDTIAAKVAGVTSIFYNGANWEVHWLKKIFPGTTRHPHSPDAVVDNFDEFIVLLDHVVQVTKKREGLV
jgi:phosphoglycolate phosphatase